MFDFVGLIVPVIIALYLINSIKILAEYERGVILPPGAVDAQAQGPRLVLVFAPIDRMVRMSLRVETLEVPSQDVVTRDNVTVKVSAVVFFRVVGPAKAVVEVSHYVHATSQLAQTRLRSVLGEADLDELLSQREKLNARLQETLDDHTGPWGIKVQAVEVKHVDLPEQMSPRHRPPGRSRARTARQGHSRRRRNASGGKTDRGGRATQQSTVVDYAALLADLDGNRHGEEHDGRVPAADRHFYRPVRWAAAQNDKNGQDENN